MELECPACHSALHPSNTSCPVCLRPRSPKEIVRGLQKIKHEDSAARKRPFLIIGALALIGTAFYAAKTMGLLQTARALLKTQSPAPAPAPKAPDTPVRAEQLLTHGPAPAAPPSRPVAAPAPEVPAEPAPMPVEDERWKIHGVAYDLLDLRPIAGARIIFRDKNSGKTFQSKTDAKGRYAAKLPPLSEGGYEVSIARQGYQSDYLEEMDPPYKNQSRARREEAGYMMSSSRVLHVPVLIDPATGDTALRYDLILLPLQ